MAKEKKQRPNRTLRIDILSLFFIICIVSFGLITWYVTRESTRSIQKFASSEISRITQILQDKTLDFEDNIYSSMEISGRVFGDAPDFNAALDWVRDYLLTLVHYNGDLSKLYVADMENNFALASQLSSTTYNHYRTDKNKALPQDARYSFWLITKVKGKIHFTVSYYNEALKEVASETAPLDYDPKIRPWYTGAMKAGGLFWTDVYRFIPSNDYGITASRPFHNPLGKLKGVIGADLSFILLSKFFENQQVGRSSQTYLVNTETGFILPKVDESKSKLLLDSINIRPSGTEMNAVRATDGTKYLLDASSTPLFGSKKWKTVVLVPYNHYFAYLLVMQRDIMIFLGIMLVIVAVIIFFFARRISKPITTLARQIDRVRNLEFVDEPHIRSRIREIFLIDLATARLRNAVRSFARYVPRDVVKNLLSQERDIVLEGEKREMTIFFSEIADFSTVTQALDPQAVTALLAEYFAHMTKIITRHGGTIDKYLGDSVMAFWGAPQPVEDPEIRCCLAALECRAFSNQFNTEQSVAGRPLFATHFGLNCGEVIVGNIGAIDRMNYTVMGDVVNTASRLQKATRAYQASILISEPLMQKVKDRFVCRPIDEVALKGKSVKALIYELLEEQDKATEMQIELAERYGQALDALRRGDGSLFDQLSRDFPNDGPTKVLRGGR